METSTIDLSVLKSALMAGGLLRPMTATEREGFGPAGPGTKIAQFGPFTFVEDAEGMYLEKTAKNTNGFEVIATKAA